MTVNTPRRRGANNVGAFDRVANISIKETPSAKTVASNIRVVVRVRPENKRELDGNFSNVVRVLDERLLVFDPKEEEAPDFYHGKRRTVRDFSKKTKRDMRFAFDYVYDMDCTNADVYENTTRCVLDGLLDGFNCSVFAYGATGAGKTFTMKGTPESPGVMFLTMMDLYQRMELMKEEKVCDVAISYLEVYNEQIRDLLNPGDYLPIREDPNNGTVVSGLSLHKPKDARELLHMLEFGNRNRTQHPTDANAESSRSHGVFQVFVRQKERTANISADVSVAKMSLIDLAGSERATVTKNCGVRFREGANINRSLLALGNCINALAEGKSKGYVPYRNSKLTRLLKDSLGGNCRTVMIAAVSPSAMSYEDTYNTLKYADRAKNIKANLKKNVVSVDYHISHYAKLIEDLRAEVEQYKDKLRSYEQGASAVSMERPSSSLDTEVDRLQEVMFSVFQDRMNIRKEIMEMEGSERDITFRVYQKEKCLSRIALLHSDTVTSQKVTSKIQRGIHASKKRQLNISKLKAGALEKMSKNIGELERVENQVNTVSTDGVIPEILELSLRTRHLEVELRDTKRQVKYLKKLCRAQQRDAQVTDKMMASILKGFKKQYYILRSCGCATPDLEADFESVQQLLLGDREISWADQSTNEVRGCETPGDVFTEEGFNINQLLDFPVLVCVDTTPKTPHQSGRRVQNMPGSAQSVAMTPCTPGSHRKGRFTPRRSSMPVFDMVTPGTPKMSGSHQLLTPSAKQAKQGPAASYQATSPLAIDDDFEILSSGPSSALKTRSRLSHPPPPPPPLSTQIHSSANNASTLTLSLAAKPAGQVIHRPPPIFSLSTGESSTNSKKAGLNCQRAEVDTVKHSSALSGCLNFGGENSTRIIKQGEECSRSNLVHVTGTPSVQRVVASLNNTFTKIDGVEPIIDSPYSSKSRTCVVKSGHVNSNSLSWSCSAGNLAGMGSQPVCNSAQNVSKSYSLSSGPFIRPPAASAGDSALNETFTQPPMQSSRTLMSSSNGADVASYPVHDETFVIPTHSLTQQAAMQRPGVSKNSQVSSYQPLKQTQPSGGSITELSSSQSSVVFTNPSQSVVQSNRASTKQTSSTTQSALNGAAASTVTKSRPTFAPVTQGEHGHNTDGSNIHSGKKKMLNVTVTKKHPTVLEGKENVGVSPRECQSQGRRSVVRSMDFSDMPSPAGKLTFAEALKSPAVRCLQQAGVAPFSPRSPLASRENLPQRALFKECESVGKKPQEYKDHITRDLERMGLPSVRERAQSATRVPVSRPRYMNTTAAAAHRNKTYSNKTGNEENSGPGRPSRIAREPSSKPARLVRRSKSFNVPNSAPKWNCRF